MDWFHKYCKYKTKYAQKMGLKIGPFSRIQGIDYYYKYLKYKTKYQQLGGDMPMRPDMLRLVYQAGNVRQLQQVKEQIPENPILKRVREPFQIPKVYYQSLVQSGQAPNMEPIDTRQKPNAQLLSRVVILRHGARTVTTSDLSDESDQFKVCLAPFMESYQGRLTLAGKLQHQILGKLFAQNVWTEYAYSPEESRRCQDSAEAFMQTYQERSGVQARLLNNEATDVMWKKTFRAYNWCGEFKNIDKKKLKDRQFCYENNNGCFREIALETVPIDQSRDMCTREPIIDRVEQCQDNECVIRECQEPVLEKRLRDIVHRLYGNCPNNVSRNKLYKRIRSIIVTHEIESAEKQLANTVFGLQERTKFDKLLTDEEKALLRNIAYVIHRPKYHGHGLEQYSKMGCLGSGYLPQQILRSLRDGMATYFFAHDGTITRFLTYLGLLQWPQPQFAAHIIIEKWSDGTVTVFYDHQPFPNLDLTYQTSGRYVNIPEPGQYVAFGSVANLQPIQIRDDDFKRLMKRCDMDGQYGLINRANWNGMCGEGPTDAGSEGD